MLSVTQRLVLKDFKKSAGWYFLLEDWNECFALRSLQVHWSEFWSHYHQFKSGIVPLLSVMSLPIHADLTEFTSWSIDLSGVSGNVLWRKFDLLNSNPRGVVLAAKLFRKKTVNLNVDPSSQLDLHVNCAPAVAF